MSSTPRRSTWSLSSQRNSSSTSSIFFSSRTAATPNMSLMLMMPSPRTSMWCLMSSEARPTSSPAAIRRTSTRSSATRRKPRMISSSAASDLPMLLLPSSSTPTPSTSTSTPCRLSGGGQGVLHEPLDPVDHQRRRHGGAQHRHPQPVGGIQQVLGYVLPLGHDHAGRLHLEEPLDAGPGPVDGQALQVAQLGRPQDLDPLGVHLLDETGQRQPRLLDAGHRDAAVQAPLAGQQLERQLRVRAEQLADGEAWYVGRHRLPPGGPLRA